MPKRVLVVDDSDVQRRLLRSILEPASFEVEEADGGHAAIELLSREDFDAIVLDLGMAKGRGEFVIQWITTQRPELARRVLVVSGDPHAAGRSVVLERAGIPFLAKPFRIAELLAAVRARAG